MFRIAPFLLIVLFFSNANAQVNDGFDAFDQKEYAAALGHFSSALTNEKERIPALWGMAQVLANPDYEQHDYDSAFVLKSQIETALRKYKDAKGKKKWGRKFGLNAEQLKLLAKPLPELRWNEIDGSKQLRDFDRYERVYKNRMPAKTKKTFQAQQTKSRRDAVNGGSVTYSDIDYLLDHHDKFIRDSFPGRVVPLQKTLFTVFMDEKGRKLDAVPIFFKEQPNSPITLHSSTNAFSEFLKTNSLVGWAKFLQKYPDAPTEPYISGFAAAELAQKEPTETELKQLTEEEQWILDDLRASAKTGVRITANTDYKGIDTEQWATFIRRRKGRPEGFVAMKNMLKYHINIREWQPCTQLLQDFGPLFPEEAAWVKSITDLVAGPDNGVRPETMGTKINTKGSEYSPTLTYDGNTMAFCGTTRSESIWGEDIYITERDKDGNWGTAQLNRDLSGMGHEAPMCFTADGNTLVLFKNGKIFASNRNATGWSPAQRFEIDLSEFDWVADVHFVPGEQRVFFAGQPKGYGGRYERNDIYMSSKDEDGNWSKPEKLDSLINTDANDRSPFIHPDQTTMYFSSARPGGLGDLDVYKTVRLDDTWKRWTIPVNLGKNINTNGNNWGYSVTTDGTTAYYSAKVDDRSDEDIFLISLPKEARPQKQVLPVKVLVVDKNKKPLPNAKIEVRNSFSGTNIGEYRTSPKGAPAVLYLPEGERVTVSGSTKGYYGDPVSIDSRDEGKTIEVMLIPVADLDRPDAPKFELNSDILFDVGKSDLRPEAAGQIRSLAEFAKREKRSIALGGHTDPTGADEDNLLLSKARAEAVKTSLLGFGVATDKVTAEGYGEAQLICTDNTPECFKRCRRVGIVWGK